MGHKEVQMATTTACMNQLTTGKAAQTSAATTTSLKTRELSGLLSSNLLYHQKKLSGLKRIFLVFQKHSKEIFE
jgi:hypothetical protein